MTPTPRDNRWRDVRLFSMVLAAVGMIAMSASAALAGPRIISAGDDDPAPAAAPEAETQPAASESRTDTTSSDAETARDRRQKARIRAAHRERMAARDRHDVRGVEVGVTTGILTATTDWLDSSDEGVYGTFGWITRWRFSEPWSLISNIDFAFRESESGRLSEDRISVELGAAWYFFDPSFWQPYFVFGIDYAAGFVTNRFDEETSYDEFGGFGGVGIDFYFGRWRLNTEWRFSGMYRGDDDRPSNAADYTRLAPESRGIGRWTFAVLYSF